jgi:hypothetical protein
VKTTLAGLAALHEELAARGGAVADALAPPLNGAEPSRPAQVAASGPRTAGAPAEYELLIEMILEGARLHYGEPRLVRRADADLRLLLGDQLYALGLQRLAALGDLDAVRELADTISLVAQAQAEGDTERASAVWEAGAVALGWGSSERHIAAKALARDGAPGAASALHAAARRRLNGDED